MAKFKAAALMAVVTKAKDYARKNPEKTSGAIGKVEGFARSKAGPRHSDKVVKGGDALRRGLGVPGSGTGTGAGTGAGTGTDRTGGVSGGGQVTPPPPPAGGPTPPPAS